MNVLGLWLQTAEVGWVRADQIIRVAPGNLRPGHSGEPEGEPECYAVFASVAVPQVSADGSVRAQSYRVASFPTEEAAAKAAFSLVHCLATHSGTAGLVRLMQERAEVTPFGELRLAQPPI